jgi:hypothetical protein
VESRETQTQSGSFPCIFESLRDSNAISASRAGQLAYFAWSSKDEATKSYNDLDFCGFLHPLVLS